MKFEIKSQFSKIVLFSVETETFSMAVELAVKSGARLFEADLSGANLRGADLSKANLSGANLFGADLFGADLPKANLSGADLRGADLSKANLFGANLFGADLSKANLSKADLRGANLSKADLFGADLSGADLRGANLFRVVGINANLCTSLLILSDQPGKIRAYKLVNADGVGPFNGGIKYVKNKIIKVSTANTNVNEQCGSGINLATLDWCMREWKQGYRILIAEFTAKDIAAIPTATDGKFRVHRCKIVGEKDLKKIGLVKKKNA